MDQAATIQIIEGAPQTRLRRSFKAPQVEVFDAWTRPEILARWWGPHVIEVVECAMDLRAGGSYRITMQMPDGQRYPMFGTVHDLDVPDRYTLTVQLNEHPVEWIELFRPKGTELEALRDLILERRRNHNGRGSRHLSGHGGPRHHDLDGRRGRLGRELREARRAAGLRLGAGRPSLAVKFPSPLAEGA